MIGTASSGFFGSDTLKTYLNLLSPQRVVLAPDAGAINNTSNIPTANRQTIKFCQAWGYSVDVLWWGQTHKQQHFDIDQLLVAGRWGEVQVISPDKFFHLHPVATREKLENHTPQRAGLHRSDFPVANPHPAKSERTPTEYQAGERRQTWIDLVQSGERFILDASLMGLGKSYDAGLLQPSDFGVSQIVFVTGDPRNAATNTLKGWTVNQGRHGGLVEVAGPNGTTQIRRAKKGETPDIKPNCDRHQLAEILPARNVEATGTHVCPGCKHRKNCNEVVQVVGAGLLGFNRGEQQQRQSLAVVESLLKRHPDALVIDAMDYARDGDGYWFRDSRGRNAFQKASTLILVGAPFPQLGAVVDEFAVMTGRHPDTSSVLRSYTIDAANTPAGSPWWVRTVNELADAEAATFYRHRVQAELEQAIGRLRGNRRPGEKLTVYVISDYPLDRPVQLVEAETLAPEAAPQAVATDRRIEQAIAQLQKLGEVTLKAIAKLAQVSLGRVSKSLAWKSYQERVSGWFVDFPNAINVNISAWKNHKTPAFQDPESVTAITPETVPAPAESVAIASTPTPYQSPARAVEILTRSGEWLRGYFYLRQRGDRHQLADPTGYRGIFVTDDEFRFLPTG